MLEQLVAEPLLDDAQVSMLREAIDEGELHAMFAELPASARRSLEAIEAALESGDLDRAKRAAHVLKGAASSFGAARLSSIASEIELSSISTTAALGLLPTLSDTIEQTIALLPGSTENAEAGRRNSR